MRALRTARGLSQAEIAGRDFTKGYISQLETGRVGLSLRAAQVIAHRLGVPVADLVKAPDEGQRISEIALLEAERELVGGSAERALDMVRRIERLGGSRGRVQRLEGRALVALDRATEAIPVLQAALESFRAQRDEESRVRTLHDLAYAHARLDRPQQALVLLLECEQALRSGDLIDRTFELEVQSFLASVYARIGDAVSSEPHLERAQELAKDVVDHDALAALYGRLAGAAHAQGDYEKAADLWRRCLAELEIAGRERLVADVWHNLATAYMRLGKLAPARSALARADELQKQTAHTRLRARLKVTRAWLALKERRHAEAEALAREAADEQDATILTRGEALLALAEARLRKRAPAAAVTSAYEDALRAVQKEPVGTRVRFLKSYADALARLGDLDAAFAKAREALELARPG